MDVFSPPILKFLIGSIAYTHNAWRFWRVMIFTEVVIAMRALPYLSDGVSALIVVTFSPMCADILTPADTPAMVPSHKMIR